MLAHSDTKLNQSLDKILPDIDLLAVGGSLFVRLDCGELMLEAFNLCLELCDGGGRHSVICTCVDVEEMMLLVTDGSDEGLYRGVDGIYRYRC